MKNYLPRRFQREWQHILKLTDEIDTLFESGENEAMLELCHKRQYQIEALFDFIHREQLELQVIEVLPAGINRIRDQQARIARELGREQALLHQERSQVRARAKRASAYQR